MAKLSVDRGLLGDYGGQVLSWLATTLCSRLRSSTATWRGGDTAHQQIGRGQLLLVAAALTAPIVGSLISIHGKRTFGREPPFLHGLCPYLRDDLLLRVGRRRINFEGKGGL